MSSVSFGLWLLALLLAVSPVWAQHKEGGHGGDGRHGNAAHHQRFDDPEKWAKQFDDVERAAWQKPDEVVKALALQPGMKVADIGAGTGYFAVRLARAVPAGVVYAVDREPKMAAYLAERGKSLELANLRTIVGTDAAPNLPEQVDLVLLVNVYHHIDKRPDYFRRLASSLTPGGRIAIIDQNMEAPRGPPKHHRMTVEQIDGEMKQAGFARLQKYDFLPYQNFVVFRVAR